MVESTLPKEERSLNTLVTDLSNESTELIHQEMALARSEMQGKVSQIGYGFAALAVAGVVLFVGFLKLLYAAVVGITEFIPGGLEWLAPLIVGLVVLLIGVIMMLGGKRKVQSASLMPHHSAESLHRDQEFVQEQTR